MKKGASAAALQIILMKESSVGQHQIVPPESKTKLTRPAALPLAQPALMEPCARGSSGQQEKASVGRVHLCQDLLAPKGLQHLNRPRGPPRSMSDPIGLSEMNLPLRL